MAFQAYAALNELITDGPHNYEEELQEIEHKILKQHTRLAR